MLKIIKNAIKNSGLDPAYLDLEVTETTIMDDVQRAIKVLEDIKELGINISIDDFGTGYSSLSYLKKFPIDTLKIDQSFISTMDTLNPSNTSIANLVIDLGHKLGMNVIAEGVETQEQVEFLKNHQEDPSGENPFFIGLYNLGTHAWQKLSKDGKQYNDERNNSLNTVHTLDYAFGKFWQYYKKSQYSQNTIIIFVIIIVIHLILHSENRNHLGVTQGNCCFEMKNK